MSSGITCGIPTKNRYDTLILALQAVALQTLKPDSVIIIDDSDNPVDLRTLPAYQSVFHLLHVRGISSWIEMGAKAGQHVSHQRIQSIAKTDWIWRVDDDEIPEPDVLEKLWQTILDSDDRIGAVGGLVPQGTLTSPPRGVTNTITDLNRPNVQWFSGDTTTEVEHLHSSFLYRRGIVDYELSLSPAAHREETIFTYELYRKGYKLLVNPTAVTWHFPAQQGGIRSHRDPGFWNHDENVFAQKCLDWGVVKPRPEKIIVLDAGRGDHIIVKSLLPKIKAKYPQCLVATCFPDILDGEITQISIGEARRNLGNLERHSIYGWCIEHNWTGNLVEAFERMYQLA